MGKEAEGKERGREPYNSGGEVKERVRKSIVVESRQLSDAGEMKRALSLNYSGVEKIRIDHTQEGRKGDSYEVQKPMCVKEKKNGKYGIKG